MLWTCPPARVASRGKETRPDRRSNDIEGNVGGRFYTIRTRYVYTWCMSKVRTNIEIEDTYLQAVMNRYSVRTKTEAVDLALRHLAGQPMTREEALAMRGARSIDKISADTGPSSP
jgi:Arc/MetJ family transcription regulator